jgi:hypothetical protein
MAELTRRHRLRKLKTPRSRVVLITLAALLVVFQAYQVVRAQWGQEEAQSTTAVVEQQRDGAAAQAASLASQIKTECADGTLTGPLCEQAEKVAAAPIPGPAGADGRGITGTNINGAGRLIVTYSDGSSEDVGVVVGAPGADGADGGPGRGITGTQIANGRLILAFTDGTTEDVGPVVGANGIDGRNGADGRDGERGDPGADGRGIADVSQDNGRLIVTYTDGSTDDVGPLPVGPPGSDGVDGADGAPGPQCEAPEVPATVTYAGGETGTSCVDPTAPVVPPAGDSAGS